MLMDSSSVKTQNSKDHSSKLIFLDIPKIIHPTDNDVQKSEVTLPGNPKETKTNLINNKCTVFAFLEVKTTRSNALIEINVFTEKKMKLREFLR